MAAVVVMRAGLGGELILERAKSSMMDDGMSTTTHWFSNPTVNTIRTQCPD